MGCVSVKIVNRRIEPTFNSRLHPEAPEWNEGALGPTKWTQGLALAEELLRPLR